MFKSHLIKSNHSVLRKNEVEKYGALVLHLIIAPPLYQPKLALTSMSIHCILDFYCVVSLVPNACSAK
jgi:hypothetical protein